jgi:hypothetical protein
VAENKTQAVVVRVTGMSDGGGRPCPICDRAMNHRHCKYVCPEHGVVYDCSDTFY